MTDRDPARDLLPAMAEARARFMELVAEVRPELHRYCARMTGNVFDGEDVVQDTLAKAYFALSEMGEPPPLRAWLFRIAHNTAMDFLRRYERKHVDLVADVPDVAEPEETGPDPALVEAALTVFASLPPIQRSAIVLKDVLGHSLEETAATMGTTVLAVKAALVRARANIAAAAPEQPSISAEEKQSLQRYAELFNARNWDGLRALLGEEARLEVVSRWQRRASEASGFFTRYAQITAPRISVPRWVSRTGCRSSLSIDRVQPGRPTSFACSGNRASSRNFATSTGCPTSPRRRISRKCESA